MLIPEKMQLGPSFHNLSPTKCARSVLVQTPVMPLA